jgi:hypothetical protein
MAKAQSKNHLAYSNHFQLLSGKSFDATNISQTLSGKSFDYSNICQTVSNKSFKAKTSISETSSRKLDQHLIIV